jgi:hypothetical protein
MEKEDKVTNKHATYAAMADKRKYVRDVYEDEVRDPKYLRQFDAEPEKRFKDRKNASTLHNLYKQGIDEIVGMICTEPVELQGDVAKQIVDLWENIDKQGTHGDVFVQDFTLETSYGHALILVDAPVWPDGIESQEDANKLDLGPRWSIWSADCITNWQDIVNAIKGRVEIRRVVLREERSEITGRFTSENVIHYREYFLDELDRVNWHKYKVLNDGKDNEEIIDLGGGLVTIRSAGRVSSFEGQLPIAIAYSNKKGVLQSKPLHLGEARENIRHFNKQSNFDTVEIIAGNPIPWARDLIDEEEVKTGWGPYRLVKVGGEFGQIGWMQVDSAAFAELKATLKDSENKITSGMRSTLLDKTAKVEKTATESVQDDIGDKATIKTWARSIQDAVELALGHTSVMFGLDRKAGGSVILGTAWNLAKKQAEENKGLELERHKAEVSAMTNGN